MLLRPPRGCHVLSTSSFSLSLFILSLYSLSPPPFLSSLSSLPLSDGLSLSHYYLSSLSSLPLTDSLSLPLFLSSLSSLGYDFRAARHFSSFLTRDLDLNKPFFDLCCSDSLDPKRKNLVSVSLERSGL